MGKSNTESFLKKEMTIANYCKALSHPARIVILRLLINKTTRSLSEIVAHLDLVPSTVSEHLKKLKKAGLIKNNKNRKGNYIINENGVKVAMGYMGQLLDLK